MPKFAYFGAGSTVFSKILLAGILSFPELAEAKNQDFSWFGMHDKIIESVIIYGRSLNVIPKSGN